MVMEARYDEVSGEGKQITKYKLFPVTDEFINKFDNYHKYLEDPNNDAESDAEYFATFSILTELKFI